MRIGDPQIGRHKSEILVCCLTAAADDRSPRIPPVDGDRSMDMDVEEIEGGTAGIEQFMPIVFDRGAAMASVQR